MTTIDMTEMRCLICETDQLLRESQRLGQQAHALLGRIQDDPALRLVDMILEQGGGE